MLYTEKETSPWATTFYHVLTAILGKKHKKRRNIRVPVKNCKVKNSKRTMGYLTSREINP